MKTPSSFDAFSATYTQVINQGLSMTGGDRATYARLRVEELKKTVTSYTDKPIRRILDFGCGDGFTSWLLGEAFGAEVVGVDSSRESLNVAQKNFGCGDVRFIQEEDVQGGEPFDLAYCNGVFHHIPPEQRASALGIIHRSLAVGGFVGLFDNTPWNPGTRFVMRRIPFDHDAVVVSPRRIKQLMAKCEFRVLTTKYLFSIPPVLRALFFLDHYLRWLPTGGQYLVVAQKTGGLPAEP